MPWRSESSIPSPYMAARKQTLKTYCLTPSSWYWPWFFIYVGGMEGEGAAGGKDSKVPKEDILIYPHGRHFGCSNRVLCSSPSRRKRNIRLRPSRRLWASERKKTFKAERKYKVLGRHKTSRRWEVRRKCMLRENVRLRGGIRLKANILLRKGTSSQPWTSA